MLYYLVYSIVDLGATQDDLLMSSYYLQRALFVVVCCVLA